MRKLIRKLNFRQAAEILGIDSDDVRALVVEERRIPAVYVTQVGYSEPYEYQILKVDAEGRAFDLTVGGMDGTVHTGYLRIERDALERFMLAEGIHLPLAPHAVKAEGRDEAVQPPDEQEASSMPVQAAPAAEQAPPSSPEQGQAAPAAASAQQSVVVQVVVVNAQALPSTTEPDPARAEPAVEQVLPSAPMQAAPATEQSPSHEPVQRSSAQGAAILDAIRKAGHEPRSLPNRDAGKRGIKALVRNELVGKHKLFPKDGRQFDKAWERLRAFEEIAGGD
jgi:hypothetical protein